SVRLLRHQLAPPQDAVNRAHRHHQTLFVAQDLPQLLRSPARLLAQSHHPLFLLPLRARRTVVRTTTHLAQAGERPTPLIASPPLVARRPRDLKLLTQPHHALFPTDRPHYESQTLIVHVHPLPRHPSRPPPRGRVLYCPL